MTIQQTSDGLLALGCALLGVELCLWHARRHRPGHYFSRRRVWALCALLGLCGAIQLTSMFAGAPVSRSGLMALLASLSCLAASLALARLAIVAAPPGDFEDFKREISGRRRAEAALKNSEAAARKLAEADARKNEFLAMLGHELRNPLAPIRNAVKVMKQLGGDNPELCWARDVVDHQVRHMAQLVDELLEISRVTSGKVRLQREPIEVATIVAYAVETSRPVLESYNHRLSISGLPEPTFIDADPIRIAQVLSNLLNNAAKYTQPGGQIRLGTSVEGGHVLFRVRDNGIGIPREMLSRIFDLFAQVDHSLDHSQGGLGLGLTLAKSLVEMHGGSVQAVSDGLNRGSEFIVRLPVFTQVSPSDEPSRPLEEPIAVSKDRPRPPARRVLVVDDNVSSAESMAMILKLEGHDVEVCYDGCQALSAVARFRPEVVLMDIGLPGMDGYEVARRLREDAKLGGGIALLAAVTGYAEDNARRRSREAGFDHHLVKPVDPDNVLALVASLEWSDSPSNLTTTTAAACPSDTITG